MESLCTLDSVPSNASTRTEFKLPPFPRFSAEQLLSAASKESNNSNNGGNNNNATAAGITKPKVVEDAEAEVRVLEDALAKFMRFDVAESAALATRLSIQDIIKRNEEYFERELKGVFNLNILLQCINS